MCSLGVGGIADWIDILQWMAGRGTDEARPTLFGFSAFLSSDALGTSFPWPALEALDFRPWSHKGSWY